MERKTWQRTLKSTVKREVRDEILSRTIRKINNRWYARIRYEDNDGNRRELLRHSEVNTKTDAKTLRVKLETELLEKGPTELVAGKITLRQLVEYAKTTRYMEAP